MELEIGKQYLTRDGRLTSPLRQTDGPNYPFFADVSEERESWQPDGRHTSWKADHHLDLVAEYCEPEEEGLGALAEAVGDMRMKEFGSVERPKDEEDILHEAYRVTAGDRQDQYGAPDEDFTRIAKMWSALKGVEFSAREVAMFQICVKLSREVHRPKRDSAVDIAGYARCMHLCNEAVAKREGL